MNERIKELESQAHELAWQEWKQLPESNNGVKIDANGLGRFKSKFAELIVQETLTKIDEVGYKSSNNISADDTELFKSVLKRHFGFDQ